MLEKFALLKIALCRAPAFSSTSSACFRVGLSVPSVESIRSLAASMPFVTILPSKPWLISPSGQEHHYEPTKCFHRGREHCNVKYGGMVAVGSFCVEVNAD